MIRTTLLAQGVDTVSKEQLQALEIGAGVGLHVYQGDLTPNITGSFKTIKPGVSIWLLKPINNQFAIKLNMSVFNIQGDDIEDASKQEYRYKRSYYFTSSIKELSLSGFLNLLTKESKTAIPYISAGAGLSFLKTKITWSNTNFSFFSSEDLRKRIIEDSVHGAPKALFIIPIGAGVKFKILPNVYMNLDGSYRICFTDYLDGISVAGNNKKNDYYYSFNGAISYRFGKSSKDKVARNNVKFPSISDKANVENVRSDIDGDGIYDANDSCPLVYGYAKYNGCPVGDKDLDGVTDDFDKCPDVKGIVENYGCPPMSNEKNEFPSHIAEESTDSLRFIIYFEWAKSDLYTEGFEILNQVLKFMKKDPTVKVIFRGHTDNVGSIQANYSLSQKRTNVCASYLQSYLINPSRITQVPLGKLNPAVELDDPLIQWRNRRVEVILYHN